MNFQYFKPHDMDMIIYKHNDVYFKLLKYTNDILRLCFIDGYPSDTEIDFNKDYSLRIRDTDTESHYLHDGLLTTFDRYILFYKSEPLMYFNPTKEIEIQWPDDKSNVSCIYTGPYICHFGLP